LSDIGANPFLRDLAQGAVSLQLAEHFDDLRMPLRVAFFDGDYIGLGI
jgi:hypothetical protein